MKNQDLREEIEALTKEIEDLKALFILFLQKIEVDNSKIGKALGFSSAGRISQLIDRVKYPRK